MVAIYNILCIRYKIVELYGADFVQEGTSYVYTRESTILSIIVQDGVVISIEYRLDI